MTASIPNEEEVLGYLQSLCNWGRWGDDDELAQVCREKTRWEFMVSIGPLRLSNTTGSPVNPVAIF